MAIMSGLRWKLILVQDVELREALPMIVQMVRILEGLRYGILVVS